MKRRKERKADPNYVPEKPKTQEDMREKDDSMVTPDLVEEVKEEEKCDEFQSYFDNKVQPKILFTTALDGLRKKWRCSKYLLQFISDLLKVFPNSYYYRRKAYPIKDIQQYCINRGFTDLIIIGERLNRPFSLIHIHLPEGPTALYRVSSAKLMKEIKVFIIDYNSN